MDQARPLGDELIDERLTNLPPNRAQLGATRVVAARPTACWDEGSSTISSRLNTPLRAVRETLLAHVKDWNTDPRRAATKSLREVNKVKMRMADAAQIEPEQRWAVLAGRLDQPLPDKVTGRRWRSCCKPFMIKDTTLPRSLEVS